MWGSLGPPPTALDLSLPRWPPQDSGTPRRKAMGPRATAGQAEAQQLQELQSRTEKAERRLLACENLVGELGNNLAALGNLLQDYGHLQQRLDNVENLLKNRNFWILRLPPGSRGEVPKVTASSLAPGSTGATAKTPQRRGVGNAGGILAVGSGG